MIRVNRVIRFIRTTMGCKVDKAITAVVRVIRVISDGSRYPKVGGNGRQGVLGDRVAHADQCTATHVLIPPLL